MNRSVIFTLLACFLISACQPAVHIEPTNTPIILPTPTVEPQNDTVASMDTFLTRMAKQPKFSGAVLVAKGGEVLLSKGYNMADTVNAIPNTSATKFRIGSVTKQFTSAAILILQEQGKLSIDNHACDYLTNCPQAWNAITVRQLMGHTAGVPNFTDLPDYESTMSRPSQPLETVKRFDALPLDFEPGKGWHYSNSGYILLGLIIENVSRQSYEDFLRDNIFRPLGMNDTGYDHNLDTLARGYRAEGVDADPLDMSIPFAAGALYSTVDDLYKWDRSLAKGTLLSPASQAEMFAPQNKDVLGDIPPYGFGWFIGEQVGHPAVFHGGDINGFSALLMRFPSDDAVIIILANRETRLYDLYRVLAEFMFGLR